MTDEERKDHELELSQKKQALDERRFAFEQDNAKFDRRFWHRNTTAAVAAVGLLLSFSQIMTAVIDKDKELAQTASQHAAELKAQDSRQTHDLVAREQQDLRKFVEDKEAEIFSPDEAVQRRVLKLMVASFSADVVRPVLDQMIDALPPTQQAPIEQAKVAVSQDDKKGTDLLVYIQIQDEKDRPTANALAAELVAHGFLVAGVQRVTQTTRGDVRYFHPDDLQHANDIIALTQNFLATQGIVQTLSPLDVERTFPNVKRKQFELWLPKLARSGAPS